MLNDLAEAMKALDGKKYSGQTTVSSGKSCWWVLFGLRPLFCVWFAVFRFDETQIWLGDLRVVFSCLFVFFVLVRCDLPALLGLLGPCANSFLAAYTHVRTEPQCDIGQTRGKKKSEYLSDFELRTDLKLLN